jgi:hypothetical protein
MSTTSNPPALTTDELASLLAHLTPLFLAAARHVSSTLAADLLQEVLLAWLNLYQRNQERALEVAQQSDAMTYRWAEWRARDAWRKLTSPEEPDPAPDGAPIQWRAASASHESVGARQPGNHVATEEELGHLFRKVESHAEGTVDALDLATHYRATTPARQRAIRELASGYAAHECGTWAYSEARRCLQRAA